MAPLSPKTKKYLRYALSGVLITGMALVTGFLSFTGMLVLNDSIYFAIAAFFLAGVIEGEVYAYNINDSLLKTISEDYLTDILIGNKLKKLVEEIDEDHPHQCAFLNDYYQQLQYTQDLEESRDEDNAQQLAKAKKRLKWMRQHFKDFMLGNYRSSENRPFYAELANSISATDKAALKTEITRKKWLSRLSWVLNLGAGISCGLVGLEVAQTSILAVSAHFGLAISGAALSVSVFGLAFVGALGYTFLVHNTISNMIHNDTLQEWYGETEAFFEKNCDHKLRILGGVLLVSVVVSLGIFATIATAGTWWYAAKAGAQMIPWIKNFASHLRTAAVSLMGITTLVFNIANSLKSTKELASLSAHKIWEELKAKVRGYRKIENNWQFYNPARIVIEIIRFPFKLLAFGGHLFAMSAMSDQLAGVPPIVTTTLSTASEFTTDIHVIFELSHEDEHPANSQAHPQSGAQLPCQKTHVHAHNHSAAHHHGHNHHHGHSNAHSHPHPQGHAHHHRQHSPAPQTNIPHPAHKHKHHDHDHSHADIAGYILKGVLSPVYLLAAYWDYHHSKKNSAADQLTFKQAVKKAFLGLPKKVTVEKPKLSSAWLAYEKEDQLQKLIFKLASPLHEERAENSQNTQDLEVIDELRKWVLPRGMPPTNLNRPLPPPVQEAASQTLLTTEHPKTEEVAAAKEVERLEYPERTLQENLAGEKQDSHYIERDGTFNTQLFFSKHPSLSQRARNICTKIIDRANSPEYLCPSPMSL